MGKFERARDDIKARLDEANAWEKKAGERLSVLEEQMADAKMRVNDTGSVYSLTFYLGAEHTTVFSVQVFCVRRFCARRTVMLLSRDTTVFPKRSGMLRFRLNVSVLRAAWDFHGSWSAQVGGLRGMRGRRVVTFSTSFSLPCKQVFVIFLSYF